MEEQRQRGRVLYFDYLRVIATLAVTFLHIASKFLTAVPVDSYDWQCLNVYDGVVRWSVPIFVMISGALFLSVDIDLKRLYSRNILRIVTAFLFWSLMYALASYYCKGRDFETCLREFVRGHYHMWFLFMIIGLYIVSPFLRAIVKTGKLTVYFLFLSFLFTMVIPNLVYCLTFLDSDKVEQFSALLDKANINMVLGYGSYFMLGYYLNEREISKPWRAVVYILGILGFVSTVLLTAMYSQNAGKTVDVFYSFFSVNVALEAVGVFVFFKYHVGKKRNRFGRFMTVLSLCSFGAYLIHGMVIERFYEWYNLNAVTFGPEISVLAVGSLVFGVSFVISFLLNKIPILKDYIV